MMSPHRKEVLSVVSTVDTVDKPSSNIQKPYLERIPSALRFVLVVASSLALSSALFTLTSELTSELRNASKHLEEWWEVSGLIAWKGVEVGLAWILGFDSGDVVSFIFLTHLPTYMLLEAFYNIRPTTILISYGILLASTSIPFSLLRKPSSVHNLSRVALNAVQNRSILQDRATTIYTTIAAASIFTVVLYASFETWLPETLVVHFENIPDISAAHTGPAGVPALFLALLPAGWAARDFLFVSSAGATASKPRNSEKAVSWEGEYLACAVYRKTWGALSAKTRVLVSRTFVLTSMLIANTVIQIGGTVEGADLDGASAWGSVWAFAIAVVGVTFGWIEAVDGV